MMATRSELACSAKMSPRLPDSVVMDPASRIDDDLADDLAVAELADAFPCLGEGQTAVDDGVEALRLDHVHQRHEILGRPAVGADDPEFEAPDVAQVLLGI